MKCGLAIERQSTFCYPSFLLLFLVVVEDRKATVRGEKRPFLPLPFSSLLACHVVYRLLTGLTQQWSTRKTIFGWNRVEWHQLRNDKEHDDTCLSFSIKKELSIDIFYCRMFVSFQLAPIFAAALSKRMCEIIFRQFPSIRCIHWHFGANLWTWRHAVRPLWSFFFLHLFFFITI